jgi:hypothetical protein
MSRYSGYAKTCSLLQRHAFWEWNNLLQRNHCVVGSGSKGTITLSAITPDAPTEPFLRNAIPDRIDSAGTIAMRNDTWIRHPDAKRILALLDIPRIQAREGNSHANLACAGLWVFHVADDEYISRSALFFVPSGFHNFRSYSHALASQNALIPDLEIEMLLRSRSVNRIEGSKIFSFPIRLHK